MMLSWTIAGILCVGLAMAVSLRPQVSSYVIRKKRIFLLFDRSPSMGFDPTKINAANDGARSSLVKLQQKVASQERSGVELTVISFSGDATIERSGPVQSLDWEDISVRGSGTHIGEACRLAAQDMTAMAADRNARWGRTVVVLLTDGHPNDAWRDGLAELLATEIGAKSLRLGIGVGSDVDMSMLHEFMGNDAKLLPLPASNAEEIVRYIEFGTTVLPFLGEPGGGLGGLPVGPEPTPPGDFPQLVI
jgi:uncharacterized protein YegL